MKRTNLLTRLTAGGLLAVMLGTSLFSVAVAADDTVSLAEADIQKDDRDYGWITADTKTLSYDFTDTKIKTYSQDENLANLSLRTNMVFDGKTLSCKEGMTFSFGSAVFLGDDYGIQGGDLAFDLSQTGGLLAVGLRLQKTASTPDMSGIWFAFDGKGNMTVTAYGTKLSVTYKGIPTTARLLFRDYGNRVDVFADDQPVARILYEEEDGALIAKSVDGEQLAKVNSSTITAAGYFTLYADSLAGTIDNLSFTHSTLTRNPITNAPSVDYTQWVAMDDRDRLTPTNEQTGNVRSDKQVGLFYFLSHSGSTSTTPRDITYLYKTLGLDGMKTYLQDPQNKDGYYWAEPYFGYYHNGDDWVYRKHAYMLEAAGVDFIFVDISNGATYDEALISLFDTWQAIRDEGGDTPQICFLAAGSLNAVWSAINRIVYSEEGKAKYEDLIYYYKGKPLLMGDLSSVTDANTRSYINSNFTVRHTWAWTINGSVWNWLQEYETSGNGYKMVNGSWGTDGKGNKEELAVCMGHHPTNSKGRSYLNGNIYWRNDYGFGLDSGAGTGFAHSYNAVKYFDPQFMLITGWNEWTAGLNSNASDFCGIRNNPFHMVDLFNTEYSRDGEPMKLRDDGTGGDVGFGDNYYYQMVNYIRDFKGMGATPTATGQSTITLGDANDWAGVGPLYNDNVGDIAWRSEPGYFSSYTYVNGSGRNDLMTAKVSQDSKYLYFRMETAEELVISNDSDWMNLYINADNDYSTGWEGFDFVLNRNRDGHYVSVTSLATGWAGKEVGIALYTLEKQAIVIRVDKSLLGISGNTNEFLFKWADNATVEGNIMGFMDKGDAAPNDRYAFRYVYKGSIPAATTITYNLAGGALKDEKSTLPAATPDADEPFNNGTEKPEEIETTPETDPTSETSAVTEGIVESDTVSDGETQASDETAADTTATGNETIVLPPPAGGCGSAMGAVGLMVLTIPAALLLTCRKKSKND